MSNKLTTHGNTTRRYIVSIAFSFKKKTIYGYFAMIISVDFSYPQYTTEISLYARQNIILYYLYLFIKLRHRASFSKHSKKKY